MDDSWFWIQMNVRPKTCSVFFLPCRNKSRMCTWTYISGKSNLLCNLHYADPLQSCVLKSAAWALGDNFNNILEIPAFTMLCIKLTWNFDMKLRNFFDIYKRYKTWKARDYLNYYLSGPVCPCFRLSECLSECLSAKKKLLNGCTYQKMLV